MSTLQRLAEFWIKRQHERNGGAAADRAAVEAEDQSMLRRAQAARVLQQMRFEDESQPVDMDYRRALAEQARAHAVQYTAPKPSKAIERTVDLGDRLRTVYTDGTVTEEPKGAAPRAPREDVGGLSANPFNVTDKDGNVRLAVRDKSAPGGLRFVDNIGGEKVGPGPTADMRNVEYQSQAVEPAFALVQNSLDNLKRETEGFSGSVMGMIPGSKAYFAKTHFQEQAKALLGAIVARQAGEGSRLSDDDRKAYSRAATLVDNQLLLPNGIEEAQKRLSEARDLINTVVARRKGGGVVPPGAPPMPAPAGGGSFRVLGRRQ